MNQRQSGVELLRIIAMLMVLGLHVNFLALGRPSNSEVFTCDGISRVWLQSLCVVAVNVFIMISGWFGIKPSLKGFCKIIWQVLYFVGGAYIVETLIFDYSFSVKDFFRCFGVFGGGGWFVSSYIGLYVLAPIINSYVDATPIKNIAILLVAFFSFEVIWGDTFSVGFIIGGYSTFSFIGIYLFARALNKAQYRFKQSNLLIFFLGGTIVNSFIYVVFDGMKIIALRNIVFNYINPVVILSSASLLLLFTSIRTPFCRGGQTTVFQSVTCWLGASCFGAYLLHVGTDFMLNAYCDYGRYIYSASGNWVIPAEIAYILSVFFAAVFLDQPRKIIWNRVILSFFRKRIDRA